MTQSVTTTKRANPKMEPAHIAASIAVVVVITLVATVELGKKMTTTNYNR